MAISSQKKTVIKVDYEAGLLTKVDIATKHCINRQTLYKMADLNKWEYGKNRTEIDKATEDRSLENIINKQVDLATQVTSRFLDDIDKYRKLGMMPASELVTAYNEAKGKTKKVPKEEFSRILESTKVIKTAIEALRIGYEGCRMALGMDIKKDNEATININISNLSNKELLEIANADPDNPQDIEVHPSDIN